jgi:gamma-D-glutamyl-L-lysine dipeptidyl-peptidase
MLENVRAAVAEIGARYADTRVCYFEVNVEPGEGNQFRLSGAVLDPAAYAALADTLIEKFPDLCFDAGDVRVLHSPTPETVAVVTNQTSLHAAPTFMSEQVSQLLNGWPLEVLMTHERWAFVRQADGYLGWAYRPYMMGPAALEPTHLVSAPVCILHDAQDRDAPIVTRVMGGTHVAVSSIVGDWARVTLAGDFAGWAAGADLRAIGALPFGEAGRRRQIVADALRYTGVPYLWGGCTALGIDCSGFAQLMHRLAGVTIPRDADMQYHAGSPVEFPFQPGDLVFFGDGADPSQKITHVGISLGGWRIIHSSRANNGVYEDDVQLVPHLRESFAGARAYLR